jgi:hypothetical protein
MAATGSHVNRGKQHATGVYEVKFVLRPDPRDFAALATGYMAGLGAPERIAEERLTATIANAVRARGVFTRTEFLEVCHWKSQRTQKRCAKNDEAFVNDVTRLALHTTSERLRIEALTLLDGVSWPTASVLLHFGHADPYPILDFRALWTVGIDEPPDYDFLFWEEYVRFCRSLALKYRLDMRTLDRALWQYSKLYQRGSNAAGAGR